MFQKGLWYVCHTFAGSHFFLHFLVQLEQPAVQIPSQQYGNSPNVRTGIATILFTEISSSLRICLPPFFKKRRLLVRQEMNSKSCSLNFDTPCRLNNCFRATKNFKERRTASFHTQSILSAAPVPPLRFQRFPPQHPRRPKRPKLGLYIAAFTSVLAVRVSALGSVYVALLASSDVVGAIHLLRTVFPRYIGLRAFLAATPKTTSSAAAAALSRLSFSRRSIWPALAQNHSSTGVIPFIRLNRRQCVREWKFPRRFLLVLPSTLLIFYWPPSSHRGDRLYRFADPSSVMPAATAALVNALQSGL